VAPHAQPQLAGAYMKLKQNGDDEQGIGKGSDCVQDKETEKRCFCSEQVNEV